MGLACIGDDAMRRECVFTIAGYLMQVIGAHFDHGKLRVCLYGKDGQGHADMVIQVALRGIGNIR